MILSQSQASVERRSIVNGKPSVQNLHTESLILQRRIHEQIRSNNLQAHELDITRQLSDSVKLARKRYFESLKEKPLGKFC